MLLRLLFVALGFLFIQGNALGLTGCRNVRFANVGWTDITATTALASSVLEAIGYTTEIDILAAPVIYKSLANADLDVFLGNWVPTMVADFKSYQDSGDIELIKENLSGAKYTLAVPKYVYDKGVVSFEDLIRFKDNFKRKIYAIEPGNDGNRIIQEMIDKDAYGLGKFEMIESSEAGMLSQVKRAFKRKKWIVFLGWEPHPMNTRFEISYLSGGDNYFGPNLGSAKVYTAVRRNYLKDCPNVGRFLMNLEFTLSVENTVMDLILNHNESPEIAASRFLNNNKHLLKQWLRDVKYYSKKEDALKYALKIL